MQRRLERGIRQQKYRSVIAKAAGDDVMRREAQLKINQLTGKYKDLSDAFGLKTKAERMAVSGYKPVKVTDNKKALPSPRPKPSGFQNKRRLKQHFYQHGQDFGCSTQEEYEKKAIAFFTRSDQNIQEFRRNPGRKGVPDDFFRFDPNTLEFGIMRGDGKIRTFHHLRDNQAWERKKAQ